MSRYTSKLTLALFLIIFCEGYIVLASELLAIRQMNSYVGSGADTVSILIAAVLMPLAFGYYYGGQSKSEPQQKKISIRNRLVRNIFISFFFLALGLPNITVDWFFNGLFQLGFSNRLFLTSIYAVTFIVTPVFLLGQTVPLICNYFTKEKLSQITGKILFVSTIGSFLGSIFTTIILMQYFGVNNAVNFVLILIVTLMLVLMKDKRSYKSEVAILSLALIVFINSSFVLSRLGIVYSNAYNTDMVLEKDGDVFLKLNGSSSSMIGKNGNKYPYIEYVEKVFLNTMDKKERGPKKILVIGAAGFTFGSNDQFNEFTYVDIDPDIQHVAEKYFLKHKIGDNKKFIGQDILAYLAVNHEKFDLIFLDAYSSATNIPENLLTREFFLKLKESMSENGIVIANFIVSPTFNNKFSIRIDNTFRSVYPHCNRKIIQDDYNPWNVNNYDRVNAIYSYSYHGIEDDTGVYIRNKNTASFDRPNFKFKK